MRRPYGRVNLVSLTLFAALVGGVYAVIMFAPAYADNMDVSEAVHGAFNQMGRLSDEQIRGLIRARVAQVGTHQEYDRDGYLVTKPGLRFTDDQIVIDRNDYTKQGSIRVDYEREILLKPTNKVAHVQFHPAKSGPILQ